MQRLGRLPLEAGVVAAVQRDDIWEELGHDILTRTPHGIIGDHPARIADSLHVKMLLNVLPVHGRQVHVFEAAIRFEFLQGGVGQFGTIRDQ